MSVTRQATTYRYIGTSADQKPFVGTLADGTEVTEVPAGSSFLETDTWRIARWDGATWRYEVPDRENVELLSEVLTVLREIKDVQEMILSKL